MDNNNQKHLTIQQWLGKSILRSAVFYGVMFLWLVLGFLAACTGQSLSITGVIKLSVGLV